MGLDITAYKNLKVVQNPDLDEKGYPINYDKEWLPGESMDWSEKEFPGRGEGVDSKTVYTYEDSFDFNAGSYSGYGEWRRRLASFVLGRDIDEDDDSYFEECEKKETAFWQLINFADNEGVIGSVVAKKLLQDFHDHYDKVSEYFEKSEDDYDWYMGKYEDWTTAFEVASNNGAVDFG